MYKEVINQGHLIRPLHQAHFSISYDEGERMKRGRSCPAKSQPIISISLKYFRDKSKGASRDAEQRETLKF